MLGIVFLVIVTACTVLHGRCGIAGGAKTITFNTALSLGIAYETSRALNTAPSLESRPKPAKHLQRPAAASISDSVVPHVPTAVAHVPSAYVEHDKHSASSQRFQFVSVAMTQV